MKQDEFSNAYITWCIAHKVNTGTTVMELFHKSKKCPKHDVCNYCVSGAMNR